MAEAALNLVQAVAPVKLDLGCGKAKCGPDWTGVDSIAFDGVDMVADLTKPWPWEDASVDEVHASHFLEHLDGPERIHFVNELYRVMKVGAQARVVTPHWASCRAYGDLTHKWPPVSEMWYYYLDKNWRASQAPHNDFYTCDFHAVWGYSMKPELSVRHQETQQFALENYKEAAQDLICTLTKR